MIEAFCVANAHLFQDALASQARLRHEDFVRRLKLLYSTFDGMEFDEFDADEPHRRAGRVHSRSHRAEPSKMAKLISMPTQRPALKQVKPVLVPLQ